MSSLDYSYFIHFYVDVLIPSWCYWYKWFNKMELRRGEMIRRKELKGEWRKNRQLGQPYHLAYHLKIISHNKIYVHAPILGWLDSFYRANENRRNICHRNFKMYFSISRKSKHKTVLLKRASWAFYFILETCQTCDQRT